MIVIVEYKVACILWTTVVGWLGFNGACFEHNSGYIVPLRYGPQCITVIVHTCR